MNIKLDLDITPEEVRRLMGLPDFQAFQQELLERIRAQMELGTEGYDPLSLMRPFMSQAAASMDAFQRMFGSVLGAAAKGTSKGQS
jgi:Family of unknown function (DUF6489)